jgi:hypothetical protein
MKLFLLIIPFLGIQCISASYLKKSTLRHHADKKEAASFQLFPGNLLFSLN